MAKTKTLETAFEELDGIVTKMSERDIPLEDAFKLYQDGMKLVKFCSSSIDRVEKKIIEIQGAEEYDGSGV